MMTNWNSSYLFGFDREMGWGYRYYYTYYNETGRRDVLEIILELIMHITIFIISLLVNTVVAITACKYSEIRTVTNSFLLNAVAADIVFGLTTPLAMVSRISSQWIFEEVACKALPYTQCVSAIALLWSLCFISVERYITTKSPPHRRKLTMRDAHMLSLLLWFILAILFLPIAFFFRLEQAVDIFEFQAMFDVEIGAQFAKNSSIYLEPQDLLPDHDAIMDQSRQVKTICTLVFPKSDYVDYAQLSLFAILFLYITPMILLIFNYQVIFCKLMKTRDVWGSSCVAVSASAAVPGCSGSPTVGPTAGKAAQTGRRHSEISLSDVFIPWPRKHSNINQLAGRQGSMSKHEERRSDRHMKTVRALFVNVVVVFAMWLPILVVLVLIYCDGRRQSFNQAFFMRAHHFTAALMVCHLNTIITPLLFCLFSEEFLKSIKRLFRNTIFDMDLKRKGQGIISSNNNGQTVDLEGGIELNETSVAVNRRRLERPDLVRDKVVPETNGVRTVRNGTGLPINRIVVKVQPTMIHSSISE